MIVFPNAKINLGLYVTSKREDGYHNLETIFIPVEKLCDVLEVIPMPKGATNDNFTVTGIPVPGSGGDNLCIKALGLMRKHFDIPYLDIYLHKVIPFGAGLGGGSSDAAFMLKLLNEQFDAGLTNNELETLATEIGADCAFFIRNTTTYAEGIGNIFSPIDIDISKLWIELVIPPIHVSTAFAYKNITPRKPQTGLKTATQSPFEDWHAQISNDFEIPVFEQFPEIKTIKEDLYKHGAIYASMSGSGSAVFGLFNEKPEIKWEKEYFVFSVETRHALSLVSTSCK